ncbi:MAG: hypothetical protein H7327_14400 [Herminiimonas sp.]|nr:hypothetical protein [Herminiimonas sp.]
MSAARWRQHARDLLPMLAWTVLLGLFFAQVEIQIEGASGWAASLPTWRVEQHWLLDIFWGGRAMTGYHAWVFPFITLFFHFPLVFSGQWSRRGEARVVACIMVFWISEDFLWFVMNPAFGIARFNPANVPWHKHWIGAAPTDYWTFTGVALLLLWLSCCPPKIKSPPCRGI